MYSDRDMDELRSRHQEMVDTYMALLPRPTEELFEDVLSEATNLHRIRMIDAESIRRAELVETTLEVLEIAETAHPFPGLDCFKAPTKSVEHQVV